MVQQRCYLNKGRPSGRPFPINRSLLAAMNGRPLMQTPCAPYIAYQSIKLIRVLCKSGHNKDQQQAILNILKRFAVLAYIQANAFFFFSYAQWAYQVGYF